MGFRIKKHQAIPADILAIQERFRNLKAMSSQEWYWRVEEIRNREKATLDRWDQVLQLLGVDKDKLEIETLSVIIIALQQELDTAELGSHLLDVREVTVSVAVGRSGHAAVLKQGQDLT